MREDGDKRRVAFATTQDLHLHGTTAWQEYSIKVPIKRHGKQLFFGVALGGTGKVWSLGLQLPVDGKPIWEAPKARCFITTLDRDHQFDKGSGIIIRELSRT